MTHSTRKPGTAPTSPSVLVLDDEPFMLKLLAHMLRREGFEQVHCHDNGVTALAWLDAASPPPALVFLDINMPGMDGIEFVRHLARRRFAGMLVLVSGEDDLMLQSTERLARAHQLRTCPPLRKPPKPEALRATLARWSDAAAVTTGAKAKHYDAAAVRAAIAQGELFNLYQPQVSPITGQLIGVEALVRWQHPVDGLVFPDQFIPVAETHGLMPELTLAVLRAALAQTRRWMDDGLALRVAVNVSMADLATLQLADVVITETAAHGVPPQQLQLEITESRLMQQLAPVLDQLIRLRLKRFRLSIDDFGSGHSSLVQLRDLPFDELKIDRSFTHQAWREPRLKAIFEGSLAIARMLGMDVVAEGVEDADDWRFLLASGCPVAQGYFIARPMPGAALADWARQWPQRLWQEALLPKPAALAPLNGP